jgi:3-oxoacyl-[acyl-carrier-protein] synthase-3
VSYLERVPHIERVAAFVPPDTLSVRDLSGELDLSPRQVRLLTRFLGLDQIAVAGDLELADMLTAAGQAALRDTDRDEVGHLIHAHTMQHVSVSRPYLLEEVRQRLGLRRASAFSMSHMNCVVGLYALRVAGALLAGPPAGGKVLVLTGDKVLAHRARLIPETTIQGDAAAACLVSAGPRGDRILGGALHVQGRFYQCLDGPEDLQKEYRQIYPGSLAGAIRAALENARCQPADIALVLPHNVNTLSWAQICKSAGIPGDRVYLENVPRTGHCYSSDPFINLAAARAGGQVKPGDRVVLATAGLGAAFAATVAEIGEGSE